MALTEITSKGIKDADIATADLANDAVTSAKIADDAVVQATIADEAVDEARIQISNAGTNGQYLQKQSGNTGGLTWADVPAGVGGGTGLDLNDSVSLRLGTDNDLSFYHDGSVGRLYNTTGSIVLRTDSLYLQKGDGSEHMARFINDGACELWHDDSKKLETTSTGITVTGSIFVGTNGEGISFESSNNNGIGGSNITFDDYEEGTYNPTWAGITNYTSGYNTWHYTKIGRLVNVIGQLRCKTTTNDGTDVSFTLPFTPAAQTNAGNTGNFSIGPTMHYNVETGSGNLVTYAYGGNAYGYFYNNQEDSSWWIMESQHIAFDESIYVNFTYIAT